MDQSSNSELDWMFTVMHETEYWRRGLIVPCGRNGTVTKRHFSPCSLQVIFRVITSSPCERIRRTEQDEKHLLNYDRNWRGSRDSTRWLPLFVFEPNCCALSPETCFKENPRGLCLWPVACVCGPWPVCVCGPWPLCVARGPWPLCVARGLCWKKSEHTVEHTHTHTNTHTYTHSHTHK